jgi:hypothetical protein
MLVALGVLAHRLPVGIQIDYAINVGFLILFAAISADVVAGGFASRSRSAMSWSFASAPTLRPSCRPPMA